MDISNFYESIRIEIELLQLLLDLHNEFPNKEYMSIYEYITHREYGIALDAILFDINELGASQGVRNRAEKAKKSIFATH